VHKNIVKVKQLTEALVVGFREIDGLRDGSSSHGHLEVTRSVTDSILPIGHPLYVSVTVKVQSPRGDPPAKLESLLFPAPSPREKKVPDSIGFVLPMLFGFCNDASSNVIGLVDTKSELPPCLLMRIAVPALPGEESVNSKSPANV
jgi:hypothetical protein